MRLIFFIRFSMFKIADHRISDKMVVMRQIRKMFGSRGKKKLGVVIEATPFRLTAFARVFTLALLFHPMFMLVSRPC